MIEYGTEKEKVIKREVVTYTGGVIVCFEPDFRYGQPDYMKGEEVADIPQAFYILDDDQKITYFKSKDGIKFNIEEVIDISQHNLKK